MELILKYGKKVLEGKSLSQQEAKELANIKNEDVMLLLAMADKIRAKFIGNAVDLCAIVNGRSGKCPENCRFCAQSAFHKTNIEVYGLKSVDELVVAAKQAEEYGARRFSIVTSGRGMKGDGDFEKILCALRRIKKETRLGICASLGILTLDEAKALVDAGVTRYHHNVETSRSFYPNICTSHTYDDKMSTIEVVKKAGLEVCSGGIIGLGECMDNRIEMAFELKKLGVASVPLNILNPIKGTALEKNVLLQPLEILKTFALYRFILPTAQIRTAGGRELNLRDLQAVALMGGLSGMLIGGYLTTGGRNAAMDLKMIEDIGRTLSVWRE